MDVTPHAVVLLVLAAAAMAFGYATWNYGILHGNAIALLLMHVVRWNGSEVDGDYAELLHIAHWTASAGQSASEFLARQLETLARQASLATRLSDASVQKADLPALAEDASNQWTGKFNPRPLDAAAAQEIYQCAW